MNNNQIVTIDFTGSQKIPEARRFPAWSQEVLEFIRENARAGNKRFLVFDRGFGLDSTAPHIVRDHLNFTGSNPLVGANDDIGPRFPVINDVYSTPPAAVPSAVAAGLLPGYKPDRDELELIARLGGEFYCYNLVPLAIAAAHAGCTVAAVALPEGVDPTEDLIDRLTSTQTR
ncbi:MAG: hypothetical protein AB7W16_17360 [Candidatus Obscuribacterales bacterium]